MNNRAYGQKPFRDKSARTRGRRGEGEVEEKITMALPPSVLGHLIQRRRGGGVDSREQAN